MAKNSTKEIKRRQRSISNTQKVTRAMEMVSASKMRKSQLRALAARPFAQAALDILTRLSNQEHEEEDDVFERAIHKNVFFAGRPKATKALVVVVTSDKGLIGGLNANVLSSAKRVIDDYQERGFEVEVIAVGSKIRKQMEKMGTPLVATFEEAGDYTDPSQTDPIAQAIFSYYKNEPVAEAVAVYTEFVSTLKQRVAHRRLLPITEGILRGIIESSQPESGRFSGEEFAPQEAETAPFTYTFEPDPQTLVASLVPFLFNTYVYHIILEANASEHSARMMAMRNASSNAERLLEELTLSYNKARQSAITQEINEVSSGAAALEE